MKYKHFKKITTDFLVILSPSSTKCKGKKKKKKILTCRSCTILFCIVLPPNNTEKNKDIGSEVLTLQINLHWKIAPVLVPGA